MLSLSANGLVIAGACILIWALFPLRKLIGQLPPGGVLRKWRVLTALTLLFIAGYVSYAFAFWDRQTELAHLIVPAIFFLGAGFVRLIFGLSLETAVDVRRVALLEQENITDPLTGTYNRRYLERRLKEEFSRAQRYRLQLCLALIDIDHFKNVNDQYGHQSGDTVLNELGKLLSHEVRPSDIAARYGGEEFMIILTTTAALEARALCERLRKRIESQAVALIGKRNERREIRITVSIGIAGLDQEIGSVEKLIRLADEALYRAKREGRNRVIDARQFEADDAPQAAHA